MKRSFSPATVLAALLVALVPLGAAEASSNPPPPPPPLPPTVVPTVSTFTGLHAVVVAVHLSAGRVRRGHVEKLSVTAAGGDPVTAFVRYAHGKHATYRGKIDSVGSFVKSWKVPKTVPPGKATLKVTVKSSVNPYSGSVSFVVLK